MRLDKYLCECTNISRKDAKELVKKKRVTVNEICANDCGLNVNEAVDRIFVDGNQLSYEKYVYYMLNKPSNVVSATKDNIDRTVIDLFKNENRDDLFPIGRLDKDTVGLLIVSNDGALSHHLTSPKHHVEKEYYLKIKKPLSENDIIKLEEGVMIEKGVFTKPAKVKVVSEDSILLTISEGMFHQVKRMLLAVSNEVLYLKRVRIGDIRLDDTLSEGEYRRLTLEEIESLKK